MAVFKVNWEYKWVDGEALDAIFMRAAFALTEKESFFGVLMASVGLSNAPSSIKMRKRDWNVIWLTVICAWIH